MRTSLLTILLLLLVLSAPFGQAQSTSRLVNVSSRVLAQTGQNVVVTEFTLRGAAGGSYYLRGLGPSLTTIPGRLMDPTLRLLDLSGATVDQNDNWVRSPDKDAISATGIAPGDPHEPAVIDSFAAGTYTGVLQGVRNSVGVAVSEIYDLSFGSLELAAVGVRGSVLTGDSVLISGFIITGNTSYSILIRVLGPSLSAARLRGVLRDPELTLHDANGSIIATNDNWQDSQAAEILATGLAPADARESAFIAQLSPGAYTVVVSGVGGTTGLGFLQYYSLGGAPVSALDPAPPIR